MRNRRRFVRVRSESARGKHVTVADLPAQPSATNTGNGVWQDAQANQSHWCSEADPVTWHPPPLLPPSPVPESNPSPPCAPENPTLPRPPAEGRPTAPSAPEISEQHSQTLLSSTLLPSAKTGNANRSSSGRRVSDEEDTGEWKSIAHKPTLPARECENRHLACRASSSSTWPAVKAGDVGEPRTSPHESLTVHHVDAVQAAK